MKSMDHKRRFFLFKESKNFCSVPWNYFKIDQDGSVRTCIKGKQLLGNINTESIDKILANPVLIDIKRTLVRDEVPENCKSCRSLDNDDRGDYSYLRNMYNEWFKHKKIDYDDIGSFDLSGVDLHWSNICNLKCVMCWPKQSSAIAQELKIPIINTKSDKIDLLIDWIVQRQYGIRELYFSGGEPSLIKHNLKLLDRLEPSKDLLLRVNTNMTFATDNKFISKLKKFPRVLITMSADATGKRFEYIRSGASWEIFLKNLEMIKSMGWQLRVNLVFFVPSAYTMLDTIHYFQQHHLINDFTINQLGMAQYSTLCRNLPDKIKFLLDQRINDFLLKSGDDINLSGQLSNCLTEMHRDPNGLDYRDFFRDIDSRRNTDWQSIFTELS